MGLKKYSENVLILSLRCTWYIMIYNGRQVLRDFTTHLVDFSRKSAINAFLGGICLNAVLTAKNCIRICAYMCTHMYMIYIHIYIHVYVHTYIYVYMHHELEYICPYTPTASNREKHTHTAQTSTNTYTCIYMYTCIPVYTCRHILMYMHVHIYIYVYVCIYIHLCIHTYICIFICV